MLYFVHPDSGDTVSAVLPKVNCMRKCAPIRLRLQLDCVDSSSIIGSHDNTNTHKLSHVHVHVAGYSYSYT